MKWLVFWPKVGAGFCPSTLGLEKWIYKFNVIWCLYSIYVSENRKVEPQVIAKALEFLGSRITSCSQNLEIETSCNQTRQNRWHPWNRKFWVVYKLQLRKSALCYSSRCLCEVFQAKLEHLLFPSTPDFETFPYSCRCFPSTKNSQLITPWGIILPSKCQSLVGWWFFHFNLHPRVN